MPTGSFLLVNPSLPVRRAMCVSTTIPDGIPNPAPRMTFAVFRPIPGRRVSSSMLRGTSPPYRSTIACAQPFRERALARKNPVDWMIRSMAPRGAAASAAASGQARNRTGVTWLTRASVHCAERMVAASSLNGPA